MTCARPTVTGTSAGKAKALFECALATIHMRTRPECRCSPCTALKSVLPRNRNG